MKNMLILCSRKRHGDKTYDRHPESDSIEVQYPFRDTYTVLLLKTNQNMIIPSEPLNQVQLPHGVLVRAVPNRLVARVDSSILDMQ